MVAVRQSSLYKAEHISAIRIWLVVVALMIIAMVVVGGATRMTNSGLSIVEWKPVTGVLPPLSDSSWLVEFEKYKKIPQYILLNQGMTLGEFKFIYWWEWSHRLLGRLIGLMFFVPLLVFWARGMLSTQLKRSLAGLLILGACQGIIGWWMVASGLSERTEVSQYRLAVHMTMACIIFAGTVWVVASLYPRSPLRREGGAPAATKCCAVLLFVLVIAQIFFGGLVAGLRAGLAYNTWPLMDGYLFPPLSDLYVIAPYWANHFENALTVQFQHRMLAYVIVLLALLQSLLVLRRRAEIGHLWPALVLMTTLCQAVLGIVALVLVVPLWAAILHQFFGILLLACVTIHLQRISGKCSDNLVPAPV